MPELAPNFRAHVLRPSPEEIAETHILFHTKFAAELTDRKAQEFGYTVVYHAHVLSTLRELGFRVTPASDPQMLFGELDFGFIYFTLIDLPFEGHESLIPCIAALRGIPFLGPAATLRSLSEDKALGKAMAAAAGIDVAPQRVINPLAGGAAASWQPGRWVLKPRTGVMSKDVCVVENEAEWRAALDAAAQPRHEGREFLLEEFVPGLNLTVPVVEGLPLDGLPVFIERGEGVNNVLTEAGKRGLAPTYSSEPYAGPGAEAASAAAARLATAMAPLDYARFDFRYDQARDRLVFLEVNMNCALGPAAVVARAAKMRGIDYASLVGHIVTRSLRRQRLMLD
jgi:D-alanine-D-alanine ligase